MTLTRNGRLTHNQVVAGSSPAGPSSSSDRKNALNFTLKIEPIGLQTSITGVRNTGVLGITPFLSNGNRFTLSSQLLLGIVRDFL